MLSGRHFSFPDNTSADIHEMPALLRLLPQNTIPLPAVPTRQGKHGHSRVLRHSQPTASEQTAVYCLIKQPYGNLIFVVNVFLPNMAFSVKLSNGIKHGWIHHNTTSFLYYTRKHRERKWHKNAVFQHYFPRAATDLLCMAGESAT